MKKIVMNWSGGKDSSLSLYHLLLDKEVEVSHLLTTVNETFQRVSMHGVRVELLEKQAESIGITLKKLWLSETVSMETYSQKIADALQNLKEEGVEYSAFGDIFLEDLKNYREEQLAKIEMKAIFPIWKRSSAELMNEFIDLGFKAIIVCVNEKHLDKSFAGRLINRDFVNDLPPNVDICGENGEYHSFVYEGPVFKKKIDFKLGEVVYKNYKPVSNNDDHKSIQNTNWDTGFWYQDLEISSE